ncbi:MAG: phosphate butyryltransferase, partial [candidate division Zixibacteria bacterium]|nr:phosphate butyryltransferase [candidate division Zixibacteria bacterium]
MKSLNDIFDLAKRIGPKRVAVALAEDEDILVALKRAKKENVIEGILVGTKEKIISLADKNGIDLKTFQVIDQPDEFEASLLCCELINQGKADVIMKGLVSTGTFMKAILYKDKGLEKGRLLSHVAVFEIPNYPRLLLITDAAINIAPNLAQKAQIIQNAIEVAHSLGIGNPLVACVAAVEKVNPKMPATID